MLRYLGIIGLFLLLGFMARATDPVKKTKLKLIERIDSSAVTVRHFDRSALKNYSTLREFQYDTGGYVGESLWTRFWRWFWGLFDADDKATAAGIFAIIIKYLFLALGVAALIFLIFRLAGVDAFNVIRGRSVSANVPYDESIENIYAIDLDAELEKAITQQNYRFAVRLLYLRSLRQLSDAGLIHWDINKTNSVYVDELTNAEQRLAFKLLTRQFEYVWYGEFIIDAQVYKKINALFVNFKVNKA